LGDDALEAHPARKKQAIESILEALQMPLEERSIRMQSMQQKLGEHSSTHWWNRFAIATLPANHSGFKKAV
jgi:trehalose-6-phosphate synthase